jgi:hypothetical protein
MSSNRSNDTEYEDQLAGKIVYKLLRKRVVGRHKKQINTVVNWFATHQQGDVKELIRKMVEDPDTPLKVGPKDTIWLSDYQDALKFAEQKGIDTEWL